MKRQVAYVSPELHFQPWGRVHKVVAVRARLLSDLGPGVLRAADGVARRRSATIAITTLSFGARIKLALVLALSWRPKVLILDEPTVGPRRDLEAGGVRGAARRGAGRRPHGPHLVARADRRGALRGSPRDDQERAAALRGRDDRRDRALPHGGLRRAGDRRASTAQPGVFVQQRDGQRWRVAARSAARLARVAAGARRDAGRRCAGDARRAVRRAGRA